MSNLPGPPWNKRGDAHPRQTDKLTVFVQGAPDALLAPLPDFSGRLHWVSRRPRHPPDAQVVVVERQLTATMAQRLRSLRHPERLLITLLVDGPVHAAPGCGPIVPTTAEALPWTLQLLASVLFAPVLEDGPMPLAWKDVQALVGRDAIGLVLHLDTTSEASMSDELLIHLARFHGRTRIEPEALLASIYLPRGLPSLVNCSQQLRRLGAVTGHYCETRFSLLVPENGRFTRLLALFPPGGTLPEPFTPKR
ncbi:hypothetical protein P3W85_08455 [Cupriavidus basilensis]|uniref:Uncharacterized protein n=1 Tax=Cupriavidus basilensis TaxID=68895 RepID=A0ABT6AKN2_9BURK|nr:hypothetical protein [Cupriavidus basilensis]MDF3832978.1 hypothetical protein [Cupriavidus basilensis]